MKNRSISTIRMILAVVLGGVSMNQVCVSPGGGGGNVTPSALGTIQPAAGPAPLEVTFDASESIAPDPTGLIATWDFGDGQTASGTVVTHTYAAVGAYTAVLTVADGHGDTASTPFLIRVWTTGDLAPVAVATADTTSGFAPLAVTFDASGSSDLDGPTDALTFAWDFGDGETGSGITVRHEYVEGTWTATLTVTDPGGAFATATLTISVGLPPPCVAATCELQPFGLPLPRWSDNLPFGVSQVAMSLDGRRILAGGPGRIALYSEAGPVPLWIRNIADTESFVRVALSRDGRRAIGLSTETRLHFFECDSGLPVWRSIAFPSLSLQTVTMSFDGCLIAAAGQDGRLYLWTPASQFPFQRFMQQLGGVNTTVVVSGDGGLIATGTNLADPDGAEMRVYTPDQILFRFRTRPREAATPTTQPSTSTTQPSPVVVPMPIAFSADGTKLVTCGADGIIYFFDVDRAQVGALPPVRWFYPVWLAGWDYARWLGLSDDGVTLAAVGGNEWAYFPDTSVGVPLWTFSEARRNCATGTVFNLSNGPTSAALTPDGRFLAVAGRTSPDGSPYTFIFDRNIIQRVYGPPMETYPGPITSVAISSDGSLFVAGSSMDLKFWSDAFTLGLVTACH